VEFQTFCLRWRAKLRGVTNARRQRPVSCSVAAAVVGLSKIVMLRAIQAGLISGSKNEINEWRVNPAELNRLAKLCRVDSRDSSKCSLETVGLTSKAVGIRLGAWFSDMQVKRLASLATSDQKTQHAARMHWWRLVTALRRSNSLHTTSPTKRPGVQISGAETVRRKP
jgi:hypothetical protein